MAIKANISRILTVIFIAFALLMVQSSAFTASIESELGQKETEMGKEGADAIAKEYRLGDNAEELKRLREIGNKLAAVANKTIVESVYGTSKITPFEYTFNIIEDKDVNAFCMPGGFIYVYRGLLDFVESDHELAGVIAHEVTHASHHHMVYLLKKKAALSNTMAIALLAAMLGGAGNSDVGNILLGVQLYQIAKLNGYGMQAERDSDIGAVYYMREAGYNPVGLLTFMERLARRPELITYGIYQSHPLDSDRVASAKDLMQKLKIPINRRDTTKAIKAVVKTEQVNGIDTPGVAINDKIIYRPAPTANKTSAQRAQEIANKINKALDAGLTMHELKVDSINAGVIVKGEALLVVSDADAKLMEKTPTQVAQGAAAAIRDVVWKQMVDTVH